MIGSLASGDADAPPLQPAADDRRPRSGLLVSIDGPGGVGKTTVSRLLAEALTSRGIAAHLTTQPSSAPLGQIARQAPDHLRGRALACLIAADRYEQLETEIYPALSAGKIVVTDRYVPASLVLQRLDGVDIEFILALNQHARRPDLAVICTAEPGVIEERLSARGRHNRFEDIGVGIDQARLYRQAIGLLEASNWDVLALDCTISTPESLVARILGAISALLESSPRE